MTGDKRRRIEVSGTCQEIGEFDRLIAADAGHRRVALDIALDKIVDHRRAEAALEIEDIMGNAELGRHPSRIMDILAGTAGALAPDRLAMVVELEGDADHIVARPLEESRRNGRIDSAGHGDEHGQFLRPLRGRVREGVRRISAAIWDGQHAIQT